MPLLIALTLYLIVSIIVLIGIFKNMNMTETKRKIINKFSIIISLKNESGNIKSLLTSLCKLNYESSCFEVIFVDDHSTDNTFSELLTLIKDISNFALIKNESNNSGKKFALTEGINKSQYDIIIITDADCIPDNNWLNAYNNIYNQNYDLVFGIAPYKQKKGFTNLIACFENLKTHILTFSFAKLGFPYSAAARNFSFKKKLFYDLNGYENTMDVISGDDDLFIREAVKHKAKIGILEESDSFVFSETEKTLEDYFRQKTRHTATSHHYLLIHKIALGVWHFLNLVALISSVFFFLDFNFIYLLPIKVVLDTAANMILQKRFSYKFSFLELIYLQIVYEVFIVAHFYNSFTKSLTWK